jgi:hypothetical protein
MRKPAMKRYPRRVQGARCQTGRRVGSTHCSASMRLGQQGKYVPPLDGDILPGGAPGQASPGGTALRGTQAPTQSKRSLAGGACNLQKGRRPPRPPAAAEQQVAAKVQRYFAQGRGTYGTRRITPLLAPDGLVVSRRRIGRRLAQGGGAVKRAASAKRRPLRGRPRPLPLRPPNRHAYYATFFTPCIPCSLSSRTANCVLRTNRLRYVPCAPPRPASTPSTS